MNIYEAAYCGDLWEGGYDTISLHRSKEGAERAIGIHREYKKREFGEIHQGNPNAKWEDFEGKMFEWAVFILELKD